MYLVTWKDWKTAEMQSMRLDAKNVARFIAILISDVKPTTISISPTT